MNLKSREAKLREALRQAKHQEVPGGIVHAVIVLGATAVLTAMVLLKAGHFSLRR